MPLYKWLWPPLCFCLFVLYIYISLPRRREEQKGWIANTSYVTCFGNEKNLYDFQGRGCLWENMCLLPWNQTPPDYGWRYFVKQKETVFSWDPVHGPIYTLFPVALTQFDAYLYIKNNFCPQIQLVHQHPTIYTPHTGIHVLWRPWSVIDANLGHLLWEELASIYYLLLQLPVLDHVMDHYGYNPDAVKIISLLSLDEIPSHPLFHKIVNTFLPVLSTFPLQYLHNFTTIQCFEKVAAGGATIVFLPESRNLGKEHLFKKFRQQVLSHFHIFNKANRPFQIILTRKNFTFLGGYRRRIENLDAIYRFLQAKFSHQVWINRTHTIEQVVFQISIETWIEKSLVEQIAIMHQTRLLITPPGGISMLMPFLPHRSHAIITDFYSSKAEHGFPANISASMEAPFWNHWPHFKKFYYQVWPGDFVMDIDSLDTRNYASVVMQPSRLNELIDLALEEQGLVRIN